MRILLLFVVICVIAFFPQKAFSVSPDTSHHTSAISPHEITLFGQRNIIQSDGIWILRDGKYSARSETQFVVFRKDERGVFGFVYYREPPDAYCFSGDIDVNSDMLIQGIQVQQINLLSPWFSEEKRAIDLDSAVITMRISLSNLHVTAKNGSRTNHSLYLEVALDEVWGALDFCDIFFMVMDTETQ